MTGDDASTSSRTAPGAGGAPPPGLAPGTSTWVAQEGAWRPVGTATRTDARQPAPATWVVTPSVDALVDAVRVLAPDGRTLQLLERHVRHGRVDGHPHVRVDRGAHGKVVLTVPTVSFVTRTNDVHTGWITCLLAPGLVVMTEQGDAGVLARAADRLEDDVRDPDEGVWAVLATVLLVLAQKASRVEVEVGDAVARVERSVFSPGVAGDVLTVVYDLKREIAEARRAVSPVGSVLPDLDDAWSDDRHGTGAQAWLRRVHEELDRIDRHLDGHDGLLGDMLDVHLALVSVQQNEDMRKISAWAAMIAVPTLVAGIYGMNFRHMPELSWTFGYPLALLLMAASSFALWRAFRRSGWL